MNRSMTGGAFAASLLAAAAAGAAPAASGPFAFTGAQLGMTLHDWRALPFPAGGASRARPVCSGESEARSIKALRPAAAERKAGAVVCGYFASYGRYQLPEGIRPGAGRKPVQVRYLFVRGRLSQIRYRAPLDTFAKVTARLKAAYGRPAAIVRDRVSTELGDLERVRMTWAAPGRTVVLTDPADAGLGLAVVLSGKPA